jgi:hypothetical protein
MTFVAGQKGWDGVVLLLLITVVFAFGLFYGYNQHAARWLKKEGFVTTAFGCEFAGRTVLLGAVQLLSTEKKTYWMDGIIAPAARRDAWLKKIGAIDSDSKELEAGFAALGQHDEDRVNAVGMQTIAGVRLIQAKLEEKAGARTLHSLAGKK